MKNGILFLVLALFLYNFSFAQSSIKLTDEPELNKIWIKFKQAIKNSDKNSLKSICTDSVKFSMQMGDMKLLASAANELPADNNSKVIIDFDNFFYLKFDEFYTYEMPQLFDKNVIDRLDDENKLRLIKENEQNTDFKLFITVVDPDPEDGSPGNEMVLRFKKLGSNYRFSGIDTIQ